MQGDGVLEKPATLEKPEKPARRRTLTHSPPAPGLHPLSAHSARPRQGLMETAPTRKAQPPLSDPVLHQVEAKHKTSTPVGSFQSALEARTWGAGTTGARA